MGDEARWVVVTCVYYIHISVGSPNEGMSPSERWQMLQNSSPLVQPISAVAAWWSNILELSKIHWANTRPATSGNCISPSVLASALLQARVRECRIVQECKIVTKHHPFVTSTSQDTANLSQVSWMAKYCQSWQQNSERKIFSQGSCVPVNKS